MHSLYLKLGNETSDIQTSSYETEQVSPQNSIGLLYRGSTNTKAEKQVRNALRIVKSNVNYFYPHMFSGEFYGNIQKTVDWVVVKKRNPNADKFWADMKDDTKEYVQTHGTIAKKKASPGGSWVNMDDFDVLIRECYFKDERHGRTLLLNPNTKIPIDAHTLQHELVAEISTTRDQFSLFKFTLDSLDPRYSIALVLKISPNRNNKLDGYKPNVYGFYVIRNPDIDSLCIQCNVSNVQYKCARCEAAYYCSAKCQETDWNKKHKYICE